MNEMLLESGMTNGRIEKKPFYLNQIQNFEIVFGRFRTRNYIVTIDRIKKN